MKDNHTVSQKMARNGSKTAIYFVIFIAKQSFGLKAAVADLIHIPYMYTISIGFSLTYRQKVAGTEDIL